MARRTAWHRCVVVASMVAIGSLQSAAQPPAPASEATQLPPAAAGPIDFARDVKPILQVSCVRCHARGRDRGGFSIETRERLLAGGDSGDAVVPGDSAHSRLIALVAGLEPDVVMPQKGSRLSRDQIGVLRAWIDQGATWDPTVSFAKAPPRNLARHEPALPKQSAGARNPVDRLLVSYFAGHSLAPAPNVNDRRFIRRVSLDAIGVLPTPAEVRTFVADARPDKRERLVARLLADNRRYAEHWLSFWNDLLRNDYRGTGYIDGGREQISAWLYASLANNMPYDRFVDALVSPGPATAGFTKGIVWRGVVNASQTPQMQAAQNISQVFMGVNLKCASCHDSFINDWQLADAYGLAAIYADGPLEMVECDRPTGKTAPIKFLYGELGSIDANAPPDQRLQELAHVLTGPKNGRLARTIVNRLWARFMGRGLVEPVDDMEQPAWHPDLLDWLAEDLVAHRYDIKRTMSVILTSRAYQGDAVDVAERPETYVFRGPAIRRMTAEQFVDAISAVTDVWPVEPAGQFDFSLVSSHAAPAAGRVRAALVNADPLMTALGRPNREQVVTTRPSTATTLQSLELLNGATLADSLDRGAKRLLTTTRQANALMSTVFLRALSRAPTARERALCRQALGGTMTTGSVEDLLWSVVMLPEFQLIR
jgi:cytochrome c553